MRGDANYGRFECVISHSGVKPHEAGNQSGTGGESQVKMELDWFLRETAVIALHSKRFLERLGILDI